LKHLVDSPRYRVSHAMLTATLRAGLKRSRVVGAESVPDGVVTMNSKVRVRDLKSGESETYTLVFPDDADINDGRLSVLAPLGTALLGAEAGDVVEFAAPAGVRRLKVEKVLYQPEAAGHYHL
jgi:regulator of nucleoside diphosphate kinase